MTDTPPAVPGSETLELWPGGYRYYRDSAHFPLGMDSVLLSSFVRLRRGQRAADLGTGCGYIPLMLLGRESSIYIDALEIVPAAAGVARMNIGLNGLESSVSVIEGDLREVRKYMKCGAYDLVVCNPPYYDPHSGAQSPDENMRTARSGGCTVADVCRAAAALLRNGGSFCLCWKPERMAELFAALSAARLEPKRMRLCHSRADHPAYLMLLDARKQANPGLKMLPPLVVRGGDGAYTREILEIYRRQAGSPAEQGEG